MVELIGWSIITLLGILIGVLLLYIGDLKKDVDYYMEKWAREYRDNKRLIENNIDHIDVEVSVEDGIIKGVCSAYKDGELMYRVEDSGYFNYINETTLKHLSDEELQQELEERKLKQNYPLAYEIKQLDCEFVELYEDGKFKDKYTKDYAWEYVKKYGKDKNIVYKAIK